MAKLFSYIESLWGRMSEAGRQVEGCLRVCSIKVLEEVKDAAKKEESSKFIT